MPPVVLTYRTPLVRRPEVVRSEANNAIRGEFDHRRPGFERMHLMVRERTIQLTQAGKLKLEEELTKRQTPPAPLTREI